MPAAYSAAIGRELDVSAELLRSWMHMVDGREDAPLTEVFLGQGRLPSAQEELRWLQREVQRLQQENAFLKSAAPESTRRGNTRIVRLADDVMQCFVRRAPAQRPSLAFIGCCGDGE